jgi:hypothetical protein
VEAVTNMHHFMSLSSGKAVPITHQLNKQAGADLQMRKQRLNSIVRALVFCARAGIALRGHRSESEPFLEKSMYSDDVILGDVNRGNFMQVLEQRRQAGDQNIDLFINTKSKYCSHEIQNELLCPRSQHVIEQVIAEIKQATFLLSLLMRLVMLAMWNSSALPFAILTSSHRKLKRSSSDLFLLNHSRVSNFKKQCIVVP